MAFFKNIFKINKPKISTNVEGYRSDIGFDLKSKMEANVYRFYIYSKIKHGVIKSVEYEPDIFFFESNSLGINSYVPDFKVTTDTDLFYIEVKGVVNQNAVNKAYLMKRDFPHIKIYYITDDKYKLIRDYYKRFIADWE